MPPRLASADGATGAAGSKPTPSSATLTVNLPSACDSETAIAGARAYLAALFSASCAMRKIASSVSAPRRTWAAPL